MVRLCWETQQPLSPTRLGKESRTPDYLLEISTTYRKEQGLVGGALHLSLLQALLVFSVPGWNWHLQTTCSPKGHAICSQRWCGFRNTFPVVPRGKLGGFFPACQTMAILSDPLSGCTGGSEGVYWESVRGGESRFLR